MITLRQLEIFAAVVEHGSFRRCGEALSISQVSVSEHIRTLEAQLGVQLFERVKGGPIHPTEAGRRAIGGVEELLSHVHDFMETVAGEGTHQGPIEIAMHGFMMRNLNQRVQDRNETVSRKIHLRSDESPPEILHQRVIARELDAAYFYSIEGLDDIGEVVAEEPLAIFVSADHPLTKIPVVTKEHLRRTPSVSLSPDKPLRRAIDAVMALIGITQVHHVIETAEFGLILSSLHRRLGYTCMFAATEKEEMQTLGLATIHFEQPLPPLQIRRLTRRTAMRNRALRDAVAMVEQFALHAAK